MVDFLEYAKRLAKKHEYKDYKLVPNEIWEIAAKHWNF